MKIYNTLFREAGADGAGGDPPLPPSLADIDSPSPETLAAAQEKQRLADEAAAAATAAQEALEKEALNDDGSLKEGYSKDADGKITKNEPAAADTGNDDGAATDDDVPEGSFWDDVDKLRGEPVPVNWDEYKDAEGNPVDPESAEGALIREKIVEQRAIDAYDAYLKATDPRGYAYMLHRQAGGSDEDFLAVKATNLPEYEVFKESIDSQSALYKNALVEKGLDPDLAQAQVDKAIKDGKLFERADAEYKAQQALNERQLADIEARNNAEMKAYTDSVNKVNTMLTSAINENKGLKFIIPDTDKAAFSDFVKKGLRYDPETKGFMLVQDIKDDNARLLESMFLLYKQGNLKDLVVREAKKENVRKLQRTVAKSKNDQIEGKQDNLDGKDKFVPLGSV